MELTTMDKTLIPIIVIVGTFLISQIPNIIKLLYPDAEISQLNEISEMLITIIKLLLNQITGVQV